MAYLAINQQAGAFRNRKKRSRRNFRKVEAEIKAELEVWEQHLRQVSTQPRAGEQASIANGVLEWAGNASEFCRRSLRIHDHLNY